MPARSRAFPPNEKDNTATLKDSPVSSFGNFYTVDIHKDSQLFTTVL